MVKPEREMYFYRDPMFDTITFLLIAAFLLLLNAFFVLAEFAAVKARPTQMEALAAAGSRRAKRMQHIQTHLDQYLSVCQIGITLASIGLGFVCEPALAALVKPGVRGLGLGEAAPAASHGLASIIAYLLISFLHIVIGELVPKSMAIRKTEQAALLTSYPLSVFYYLFIVPLWVLNSSANGVLFLLRIPSITKHAEHSEDEVRIILDRSQSGGMMSFRRLLYIENVLDMGGLTVRNAMQSRSKTVILRPEMPLAERDAVIARYRYSRYPVLTEGQAHPEGFIHLKDLYLAARAGKPVDNLRDFIRPALKCQDQAPLETILAEMQRKGIHLAIIFNAQQTWSGIITLEDVLEEVVGTIEEEYPVFPPIRLTHAFSSAEQVILEVEGDTIISATRNALLRLAPGILPVPVTEIMPHIAERERTGSSYVGRRLAIPHARLPNISRPLVMVARLKRPIPAPTPASGETIRFLFIMLTPADTPRMHQIFLSCIAQLFESDFLEGRLVAAKTPPELYGAICAVEQATDGAVQT
jgi:CBS domain containing-hemolysin-like protein/mannitol/fructose-specific phosphotransferase system IIA component